MISLKVWNETIFVLLNIKEGYLTLISFIKLVCLSVFGETSRTSFFK